MPPEILAAAARYAVAVYLVLLVVAAGFAALAVLLSRGQERGRG